MCEQLPFSKIVLNHVLRLRLYCRGRELSNASRILDFEYNIFFLCPALISTRPSFNTAGNLILNTAEPPSRRPLQTLAIDQASAQDRPATMQRRPPWPSTSPDRILAAAVMPALQGRGTTIDRCRCASSIRTECSHTQRRRRSHASAVRASRASATHMVIR